MRGPVKIAFRTRSDEPLGIPFDLTEGPIRCQNPTYIVRFRCPRGHRTRAPGGFFPTPEGRRGIPTSPAHPSAVGFGAETRIDGLRLSGASRARAAGGSVSRNGIAREEVVTDRYPGTGCPGRRVRN